MLRMGKISSMKLMIFLLLASVTIMLNKGVFSLTHKIQVFDIVFLAVFSFIFIKFILEKKQLYWSPFIVPVLVYLLMAALSMFTSINFWITSLEFIGCCYLVILFLLWINIVDTKELFYYSVWCWIIISLVVSLIGLYGIILAYGFHIDNPFGTLYVRHAYINNLYRVHSTFFQNEKFFSSYLLISMPLVLGVAFYEKRKRIKFFLFALILLFFVNLFFTFSRSLAGVLLAVYTVVFTVSGKLPGNKNKFINATKIIGAILILFVFLFVLLFSHIQLLGSSVKTANLSRLPEKMEVPYYYRPDIGIKQTDITLRYNYTFYIFLKKYALKMFFERPVVGAGNGTFLYKMCIYDLEGKTPKGYLLYDPHSMFLGSLAENGILGFSVLIFLWLSIILTVKKQIDNYNNLDFIFYITVACYAAILGFFIQGIDIDIMNFRFLWLLFGFLAVALRLSKLKSVS